MGSPQNSCNLNLWQFTAGNWRNKSGETEEVKLPSSDLPCHRYRVNVAKLTWFLKRIPNLLVISISWQVAHVLRCRHVCNRMLLLCKSRSHPHHSFLVVCVSGVCHGYSLNALTFQIKHKNVTWPVRRLQSLGRSLTRRPVVISRILFFTMCWRDNILTAERKELLDRPPVRCCRQAQ